MPDPVLDLKGNPIGQGDPPLDLGGKPIDPGLINRGNINLYNQPKVKNPDGSTSTVDTRGYNFDGRETVLPSVTSEGKHLQTDDDIIAEYKRTGRHLGQFDTKENASRFAEQLHKDYEKGRYEEYARPMSSHFGAQPLESPDSFLRSLWTKSVFGVEEPTMEDWTQRPANAAMRAGIHGMTTPFALAGELGAGLGGYALGRLTKGAKTLSKIPEIVPNLTKKVEPVADLPLNKIEETAPRLTRQVEAAPELAAPIKQSAQELPTSPQAIPEFSSPSPPKVTSEAQAYIEGIKSGVIPKGTSFDKWKTLGEPSLAERLIKEESGTYEPGKILSALKGRKEDKKITNLRNEIIETLIKGGEIRLNEIFDRAKSIGITRQKFNKVVDGIIDSDEIKSAIRAVQEEFRSSATPTAKLARALSEAKPLREAQESLYSAEKSERIGRFRDIKIKSLADIGKKMSALKGEYEKVIPSPLQLDQDDILSLYQTVDSSRKITEFEKARAITALGKLLEGKSVLQSNEIELLDTVLGEGIGKQLMELHGGLGLVGMNFAKTANTMKTIQTSLDLSAPFRQGLGLVHRAEFWKAYKEMFKYGKSEEAFNAAMDALEASEGYLKGRKAGLFIARRSLGAREEHFLDSYINDLRNAGKLGRLGTEPFAASERAYVGFLNKLRQDTFDTLLENAMKAGWKEDDIAPHIAKYVNTSTGRGPLGKLGRNADVLNNMLFSPRMIASRLQMLNYFYYRRLPAPVRKEALKTLFAVAGFIGTTNVLGSIAGGKLTGDPRSSDFGKVAFDRTRLDPGGGFLQYIVAASRFLTNKTTSTNASSRGIRTNEMGKGQTPSWLQNTFGVGGKYYSFSENKMSPMASFVRDMIVGTNARGESVRNVDAATQRIIDSLTPIMIGDLIDLYREDPSLLPLAIPTAMGMGSQVYEPRESSIAPRMPSIPSVP